MAAPRVPFNVTALNIEVPADGQREVTFSVATGVLDDTWTVEIAGTTVAEGDGTDSFVAVFPASADGQRWQLSHEGIERVAGVVIPRPLRNALDLSTLELTIDDGDTVVGLEVVAFGGGSGAVDSVNGETGTVVLTAADVGVRRPVGPAFHAAASNAAMTALSAVRGDVCFRSDLDSTLYVLTSSTPANLGDWTVLRFNSSTPVFPSSFTAKGDLLVATGAGTFAAVPRGADGTVLKAKTSETPGVEWGDAVDATRTITAGTGLTGGGDLSADRTISIAPATLARIGTTVEATSDTAARTSTTAVADGVLEFTAAADTSYRIDAYLIFQGDATADLKIGFTIPAGTMHLTVEGALTTVASGSDYDRFLTLTASAATTVVGIAGASTPISVRVTGVIRPTSAGTVALIWAPNATGAGTGVTRLARSQLYYRAV